MPLIEDPLLDGLYFIDGAYAEDGAGLYMEAAPRYTTGTFRALRFGRGTNFRTSRDGVIGWSALPPYQRSVRSRFGAIGDAVSAIQWSGRTVILSGWIEASTERDRIMRAFRNEMVPNPDSRALEELTITMAGETLTAFAQLVAAEINPTTQQGSGRLEWKAQFECPDPRRFGSEQTITVPFTPPTGGISSPLSSPITMPANPLSGEALVNNTGTAPAPVRFQLLGPISGQPGVALASAGKFVRFGQSLTTGQALTIDTNGYATLDGQYLTPTSKSALMVEMEAPRGPSTFQAIGDPQAGSPSFIVAFRPASW